MNIFRFVIRKFKRRKYPITRDEMGRSLRQRVFALFESGLRPAQVIKMLEESTTIVPPPTIRKFRVSGEQNDHSFGLGDRQTI